MLREWSNSRGIGDFFKKAKDAVAGLAKKASQSLAAGVQRTALALRSGWISSSAGKLTMRLPNASATRLSPPTSRRHVRGPGRAIAAEIQDREIQNTGEVLTA